MPKEELRRTDFPISVGTGNNFIPGWNLSEDIMLLTPNDRKEWMTYILPPGAKTRFKFLQSQ